MRIALFLVAFICLQLNAQDKDKVALTAGGEFLSETKGESKSITMNEPVMCPFDVISRPKNEFVAKLPQSVEIVSSRKTNPILYLVIILLIGFAIHFFLSKKEAAFASNIDLREEEEDQKKKELWDAMAESEHD